MLKKNIQIKISPTGVMSNENLNNKYCKKKIYSNKNFSYRGYVKWKPKKKYCKKNFYSNKTSVDTEMCCPKGKCGCQYFILLT